MTSKSESLPMTIDTSTLLMNSLPRPDRNRNLLLHRPGRNVLAIMGALKLNSGYTVICAFDGTFQVHGSCGYSQHSPSGSEITAIVLRRACMEDFHAFYFAGFFESDNFFANIKCSRVSTGCHDDADGGIARPAKIALTDASFDRGFQCFRQVTFHAHHDRLSFGISEAAIKF